MDDEPIIEVRGLVKTYPGGVEAVGGIDFAVEAGEVFGLLGPNGAGKSTTIGMLTTAVVPTGGTARLGGFDVIDQPRAARRISAVVTQEAAVDRGMSGRSASPLTPATPCASSNTRGSLARTPSSSARRSLSRFTTVR
jgi:ABC-2 type transport system ATP-binding protein